MGGVCWRYWSFDSGCYGGDLRLVDRLIVLLCWRVCFVICFMFIVTAYFEVMFNSMVPFYIHCLLVLLVMLGFMRIVCFAI